MAEPIITQKPVTLLPRASQHLKLRCCQCGTSAVYEVGPVLYEPAGEGESAKKRYSFTHYFRCQHCNSAGPWEVEDKLGLFGLTLRSKLTPKSAGLQRGHFALMDGTSLQTPAMAEDYLLQRMREQPRNASLYRRLGNVFRVAGQDARADEWYAKAVALDPHDVESRYHLFVWAEVTHDTPAALLHAPLLVRDLLAGHLAQEPGVTEAIACFVVEDLRAAPDEFRRHFLSPEHKRSKRPEEVFIRTLLTQDGEEEDLQEDATERLLRGVPEPSLLAGTAVVSGAPLSAPAAPAKSPSLELAPSLAEVVQAEGLEAAQLLVAFDVPEDQRVRVRDKHDVFVSDGLKAAVWKVPALAELFRGNQVPPPHLDHFPPEYVPHFSFIETQFLAVCDLMGDRTDQEMEEIFAALRRRPDGRSLGVAHDLVWQILALLLGSYVVSAAEYEAIVDALLTSVRRWGLRPISRNYVTYLRRSFGHPRPDNLRLR